MNDRQAIQAMVRTRVLAAITGKSRIWTTPMMASTSHRFAFKQSATSSQTPPSDVNSAHS